jgi:hypothetical protein
VPRRQVIVWDRSAANLRAAGFDAQSLGCEVRGIEPARGYDRQAMLSAPVLGKLIWGDLLFSEKAQKIRARCRRIQSNSARRAIWRRSSVAM